MKRRKKFPNPSKYFKRAGAAVAAIMSLMSVVFLVTGKTLKEQRKAAVETFEVATSKTAENLPSSISSTLGVRPKVSMLNPIRPRIFLSLNTLRNVLILGFVVVVLQTTILSLSKGKLAPRWQTFVGENPSGLKNFFNGWMLSTYAFKASELESMDKEAKGLQNLASFQGALFAWALIFGMINLMETYRSPHAIYYAWRFEALDFWSIRPQPALV